MEDVYSTRPHPQPTASLQITTYPIGWPGFVGIEVLDRGPNELSVDEKIALLKSAIETLEEQR